MIIAAFVAMLGIAQPPETLPVDAAMAALQDALPSLAKHQAEAEADIARLGPVEPRWSVSGISATAVIAAADGKVTDHVLGEWEKGTRSATIIGDYPLAAPAGWHLYTVRGYSGAVNQHAYHRLSADLVLHTFGMATRIGSADCRTIQGIELISRAQWRSWAPETALLAFAMAKATRDDLRTYCTLYRAAPGGKYIPYSYTPEGRPFLLTIEDPQPYVITPRPEAAAKIFALAGAADRVQDPE
jgi:hypothetical protein